MIYITQSVIRLNYNPIYTFTVLYSFKVKCLRKSLILHFILLNTLNNPSYYRILYPILYILLYPQISILFGRATLPPFSFNLTLSYHPPSYPTHYYVVLLYTLWLIRWFSLISIWLSQYWHTPPPPPIKLKLIPLLYHNLSQHVLLKFSKWVMLKHFFRLLWNTMTS